MSTIDAALLGEAIVLCNGNAVNLPYKKAYALLYYIIIKRKHRLTRAHSPLSCAMDDHFFTSRISVLRHLPSPCQQMIPCAG